MAERKTKIYDVYLSHSVGDSVVASEVAYQFLRSGLDVFQVPSLVGENVEHQIRQALAECRALVLIVPPSGLTNWQSIEFGAARGWDKPVYAIAADSSTTRLPDFLARVPFYPIGRLDEVIRAIQLIDEELDDEDRAFLTELFLGAGTSLDALALEPEYLGKIARSFREVRRKQVSDDRLLSELFRLRKQGKLPKPRPAKRPRSRSHPA